MIPGKSEDSRSSSRPCIEEDFRIDRGSVTEKIANLHTPSPSGGREKSFTQAIDWNLDFLNGCRKGESGGNKRQPRVKLISGGGSAGNRAQGPPTILKTSGFIRSEDPVSVATDDKGAGKWE